MASSVQGYRAGASKLAKQKWKRSRWKYNHYFAFVGIINDSNVTTRHKCCIVAKSLSRSMFLQASKANHRPFLGVTVHRISRFEPCDRKWCETASQGNTCVMLLMQQLNASIHSGVSSKVLAMFHIYVEE